MENFVDTFNANKERTLSHYISPLDGRYYNSVKDLSAYFSESALLGYRLKVEIEYLIALGNDKGIKELPPFSKTARPLNLLSDHPGGL
jgi:adenylosuccinate lyase